MRKRRAVDSLVRMFLATFAAVTVTTEVRAVNVTWGCSRNISVSISGSGIAAQNAGESGTLTSAFCEIDTSHQLNDTGGSPNSPTNWWSEAFADATMRSQLLASGGAFVHTGTSNIAPWAKAQNQYYPNIPGWLGSYSAQGRSKSQWTLSLSVDEPTDFEYTAIVHGGLNDTLRFSVYAGPLSGQVLSNITGKSSDEVSGTLYPGNTYSLIGVLDGLARAVTDGNTVTNVYVESPADWFYELRLNPVPASSPLAGFELGRAEVAGCKSVSGKVTLTSPAPEGGATVTISDTLESVFPPVAVTVPSGATTKSFSIRTNAVTESEVGRVSVTLGGTTLNQNLTVRPIGLSSVSLSPTSVVGGHPVTGKATLECKAGPGPITVDLSSNNPALASPVGASIVVPQSLQSVNFDVTTNAVNAKSYATIAGTANGITKSKKLTVNVAASVSATSLKFGSVPVGQTSAPLVATLTNKGATSFSISSIVLTGTYATWFGMTENCPTSLAPGASCTISATFKPLAALAKSAKVSITTSATSTPLSVSLSGTGI